MISNQIETVSFFGKNGQVARAAEVGSAVVTPRGRSFTPFFPLAGRTRPVLTGDNLQLIFVDPDDPAFMDIHEEIAAAKAVWTVWEGVDALEFSRPEPWRTAANPHRLDPALNRSDRSYVPNPVTVATTAGTVTAYVTIIWADDSVSDCAVSVDVTDAETYFGTAHSAYVYHVEADLPDGVATTDANAFAFAADGSDWITQSAAVEAWAEANGPEAGVPARIVFCGTEIDVDMDEAGWVPWTLGHEQRVEALDPASPAVFNLTYTADGFAVALFNTITDVTGLTMIGVEFNTDWDGTDASLFSQNKDKNLADITLPILKKQRTNGINMASPRLCGLNRCNFYGCWSLSFAQQSDNNSVVLCDSYNYGSYGLFTSGNFTATLCRIGLDQNQCPFFIDMDRKEEPEASWRNGNAQLAAVVGDRILMEQPDLGQEPIWRMQNGPEAQFSASYGAHIIGLNSEGIAANYGASTALYGPRTVMALWGYTHVPRSRGDRAVMVGFPDVYINDLRITLNDSAWLGMRATPTEGDDAGQNPFFDQEFSALTPGRPVIVPLTEDGVFGTSPSSPGVLRTDWKCIVRGFEIDLTDATLPADASLSILPERDQPARDKTSGQTVLNEGSAWTQDYTLEPSPGGAVTNRARIAAGTLRMGPPLRNRIDLPFSAVAPAGYSDPTLDALDARTLGGLLGGNTLAVLCDPRDSANRTDDGTIISALDDLAPRGFVTDSGFVIDDDDDRKPRLTTVNSADAIAIARSPAFQYLRKQVYMNGGSATVAFAASVSDTAWANTPLLAYKGLGTPGGFNLLSGVGGEFRLEGDMSELSTDAAPSASTDFADGLPHVFVVVFDDDASTITAYVDGASVWTAAYDGAKRVGGGDVEITLGATASTNANNSIEASLSAFALYNEALDAAALNALGGELAAINGATWTDV